MKVFYDHQMFSWQKYGGITRYFCEIIKELAPNYQYHLGLLTSENYYLQKDSSFFKKINVLPQRDFMGKYFITKKIYEINELYSTNILKKNNFDVFHPTFYNDYFLRYNKRPYVVTVHDLISFKFPQSPFFKHKDIKSQMKDVIKNATRIIAISESTKNDLINILNINEYKIDVIYHGVEQIQFEKQVKNTENYILFVGDRNGYKNFSNTLKAVSSILTKDRKLNFICVGSPFTKEEQVLVNNLKIDSQVSVMRVTNEELYSLYSNARLFIFPSLYEGFGMPILEAFVNNCPVCLSNSSCFPEIAGEAGVYFDPNSIASITSAIEKLLYNPELVSKIVERGNNQLKKFSWKEAGLKTLKTYEKALT